MSKERTRKKYKVGANFRATIQARYVVRENSRNKNHTIEPLRHNRLILHPSYTHTTITKHMTMFNNHHGRGLTTTQQQDMENKSLATIDLKSRREKIMAAAANLDRVPSSAGGLRASQEELCSLGRPFGPSDCILDLGCGLGERSRFLASRYGALVVGVDWTQEEFVSVGRVLTARAGLQDYVKLIRGHALRLPIADETFSVVIMDHVEMNRSVAEMGLLFQEMARVLKPAGFVLFHDMFLAANNTVVPNDDKSTGLLVSFDTMRHAAAASGLYLSKIRNVTRQAHEELLQRLLLEHQQKSQEHRQVSLKNNNVMGSHDNVARETNKNAVDGHDDIHATLQKLQTHMKHMSSRKTIHVMGILTKLGH